MSRSEEFAAGGGEHYYHGTNVDLDPGDHIFGEPHAHFTTVREHAEGYAQVAADIHGEGEPRVYRVRPTGPHEVDPHDVGDGGGIVSYRSMHPLEIIR